MKEEFLVPLFLLYLSNSAVTGKCCWVRKSSVKVAAAKENCYNTLKLESVTNLSKERLWHSLFPLNCPFLRNTSL